jgi:hypothetical protein
MHKLPHKREPMSHQVGPKDKAVVRRTKALAATKSHHFSAARQWQQARRPGPSQPELDKEIRILSNRIYAASSSRTVNSRTTSTSLPMSEGHRPMFIMYYPDLAPFGYALGGSCSPLYVDRLLSLRPARLGVRNIGRWPSNAS